MPNPNFPKFVSVNGTLLGMRDAGALKRFHVEILPVTFLGSAPPVQPTPGKSIVNFSPSPTNHTDLPRSNDTEPERKEADDD
jgi:hypothetical protein